MKEDKIILLRCFPKEPGNYCTGPVPFLVHGTDFITQYQSHRFTIYVEMDTKKTHLLFSIIQCNSNNNSMLSNSNSNNSFKDNFPSRVFALLSQTLHQDDNCFFFLFIQCETLIHLFVLVGASLQLKAVKALTQICGKVRECKASKPQQ